MKLAKHRSTFRVGKDFPTPRTVCIVKHGITYELMRIHDIETQSLWYEHVGRKEVYGVPVVWTRAPTAICFFPIADQNYELLFKG